MDVRLSAEQRALRDSAAQLVDRLGPKSVADLDDPERSAKLEAAVAGAGWRELRTDDGSGAPLASVVEAALVAEELSRGLADAAYLGPTLAAELRRIAGADEAGSPETVLLEAGLGNVARAGVAGGAPGAIALDAAGSASALLLLDAPGGDAAVVLGSVALGPARTGVDLTRQEAAVGTATPDVLVGALGDEELRRWLAVGLAVTSAELVGVMRGALDLAVEYAKVRRQYGSAIGSYQAVQHLLADAYVAQEGSMSVARHAAWAADALPVDEAMHAGAVAKAYCSRAARSVCETVIQVHGGIGNTWESLAHVFLRRALLSADVLGGAGPSIARVLDGYGIGAERGTDGLR